MSVKLPEVVRELQDYLGPIEEALESEEMHPVVRTTLVGIRAAIDRVESVERQLEAQEEDRGDEEVESEEEPEPEESGEEESSEEEPDEEE